MNRPDAIITLPHLRVQNVNIISSPLTWGFPAMTAILGFVHALERKLAKQYQDLRFGGVGVICHDFAPQIFKPNNSWDSVFCLTRNPLDKDGSTPAFVEEGRAHMEISLVIQAFGDDCIVDEADKKCLLADIYHSAQTLRLAGGSILPADQVYHQAQLFKWPDHNTDEQRTLTKKILRRLLPGFALIGKEALLSERMAELQTLNPQATALDALLEFSSLNFEPGSTDIEIDHADWTVRQKSGWLVPIPVGYSAISDLYPPDTVLNARDVNYPFCFVESIYSLGEWLSPHRINNIEEILWHYATDLETGLYRCINNPNPSLEISNLRSNNP